MKNRKRITNVLIAGTLTVLIMSVFLAFKGTDPAIVGAESTDQTAEIDTANDANSTIAALQSQLETLQTQNEELRSAVQTLQEREIEYQNQINQANETISELSAQNGSFGFFSGEFNDFQFHPEGRNH